MCIQCTEEFTVAEGSAVGGRICCLKPAKAVNIHHRKSPFS